MSRHGILQPRRRSASGNALRAAGLVAGGPGGVALLEEAVSVLEGSAARLDHARALVDLGALLCHGAGRAAGAERLREGMELAHRCGAAALVQTAATQCAWPARARAGSRSAGASR